MRQIFKFGRPYEPNKFTLFDPRYYDRLYNIEDFPWFSYSMQGSYGTSGSSGRDVDDINPQFKMKGIKKFYNKGRYPRPRNS